MKKYPWEKIGLIVLFLTTEALGNTPFLFTRESGESLSQIGISAELDFLPGFWTKPFGPIAAWVPFRFRGTEFYHSIGCINGNAFQDPWLGLSFLDRMPNAWVDTISVYRGIHPFVHAPIGSIVDLHHAISLFSRPKTSIVYEKGPNAYGNTAFSFQRPFSRKLALKIDFRDQSHKKDPNSFTYKSTLTKALAEYQAPKNWQIQYEWTKDQSQWNLPFLSLLPGETSLSLFPELKIHQVHHRVMAEKVNGAIGLAFHQGRYRYEINDSISVFLDQNEMEFHGNTLTKKIPLLWGLRTEWTRFDPHNQTPKIVYTTRLMGGTTFSLASHFRFTLQTRGLFGTYVPFSFLPASMLSYTRPNGSYWIAFWQGIREPLIGERTGYTFSPFPPVMYSTFFVRNSGILLKRNADLHPEKSTTIEMGTQMPLLKKIQTEVRLYHTVLKNPIFLSENGQFVNSSQESFSGMEIRSQWHLHPALSLELTENSISAKDFQGKNLLDRPHFNTAVRISWTFSLFKGDLVSTWIFGFQSTSPFWMYRDQFPEPILDQLPFQNRWHFQLRFQILKQFYVNFTGENISTRKIEYFPNYPLEQNAVYFGIHWDLFD